PGPAEPDRRRAGQPFARRAAAQGQSPPDSQRRTEERPPMTAAIADATPPAAAPAPLDEGAFSEEFVALLPSMRAFARSLCRNRAEADDLAQTAMMNAWRARHSYTPGTNLRAWLYTIL